MEAQVNTATGAVDVSALGRVLMHEHVFTFHGDVGGDYPWENEDAAVQNAIDKLLDSSRVDSPPSSI